jgi:hypothetical protein
VALEFGRKVTRDQESGDDEEDVDPDESAAQKRETRVIQDDQDDGNRPQPLDVGTATRDDGMPCRSRSLR